jgi:hypothetical protein
MRKRKLPWVKASLLRSREPKRTLPKVTAQPVAQQPTAQPVAQQPPKLLPYFQMAGAAAAVVAILVSLWATDTLADSQQLRSDLQASHREGQQAKQETSAARQVSSLLEAENRMTASRVLDLQRQEARMQSDLLLAETDLRARLHDVSSARDDLQQLRSRAASIETNLVATRAALARTTVSAFVSLHLARARQEFRRLNAVQFLYDPADPDFARLEPGAFFMIGPRYDTSGNPSLCHLSERIFMSGHAQERDLDVRSEPVMQALCEYLRGTDGLVDLEDGVRARQTGRDATSLQRWEHLGDGGAFRIILNSGGDRRQRYEEIYINGFWSLLDARGALSVPGARDLLYDGRASSGGVDEASLLATELQKLRDGWPSFAQRLRSDAHYDRWQNVDEEMEPALQPIERVTIAGLRAGRASTTEWFERRVVCAAAWYAQALNLIREFPRQAYCVAYP